MNNLMTDKSTWKYDEQIASDSSQGSQIIRLFVDQLVQLGWSEKEIFGVHVSIEEAIMNAIKHGNDCSDQKRVHVVAALSETEIWLQVTDEGDGFDPDDVPDPTLDENLELGSGRGLMLMRHYMDEVNYNDRGNSLEIRKSR